MTTRTAKKIGAALRHRRERLYATTRGISAWTNIDHAVISRIERGENKISLENAIRLCEYYRIDLTRLTEDNTVRDKRGRII